MARCYICNALIHDVKMDENNQILPCQDCLDEIQEVSSEDATLDLLADMGYSFDTDDE